MYQVLYDEIDIVTGDTVKRDCLCYTNKQIETIKKAIAYLYRYDNIAIEIRSIIEKKGIIV